MIVIEVAATVPAESRAPFARKHSPARSSVEEADDVRVTLAVEGNNTTRVQVVAKRSAVTWDKDFARSVLDKIVAYSR